MSPEEVKQLPDPPDWPEPFEGTQHWLCVDEVSAKKLAVGVVTARVQQQAVQMTKE